MFTFSRMGLVLSGLVLFMATPLHAQVKTAEMKKLLKERSELLDAALKELTAQHQSGKVDITGMLRLQQEVLKARLDFEEDPKERLARLRSSVEHAQKIADIADARLKGGVGSKVDSLRTRAAVLEARIELLKEEEKQKPVKPSK